MHTKLSLRILHGYFLTLVFGGLGDVKIAHASTPPRAESKAEFVGTFFFSRKGYDHYILSVRSKAAKIATTGKNNKYTAARVLEPRISFTVGTP